MNTHIVMQMYRGHDSGDLLAFEKVLTERLQEQLEKVCVNKGIVMGRRDCMVGSPTYGGMIYPICGDAKSDVDDIHYIWSCV